MNSPPYVPYQAYKSKRQSRNFSSPPLNDPEANANPPSSSTPVQQSPATPPGPGAVLNGHSHNGVSTISESERTTVEGVGELPLAAPAQVNGFRRPSRPVSMIVDNRVFVQSSSQEADVPKVEVTESTSEPSSPIASSSKLPPEPDSPTTPSSSTNAVDSNTAVAGPSTKPAPVQRKSSTFRHLPLRTPQSTAPRNPSPLRPGASHARSMSASVSARQFAQLQRPPENRHSLSFGQPRAPSSPLAQVLSTPSPLSMPVGSTNMGTPSPQRTSSAAAAPPPEMFIPPQRTSSLSAVTQPPPTRPKISSPPPPPSASPSPGPSSPRSAAPSPAITPTPSTSSSTSSRTVITSTTRTFKAPYRPGFQPFGVCRPLTDDFLALRQHARESGRVERERLERRFEKLINLHFSNDDSASAVGEKGKGKQPPPPNRRASSFFDIDINDLRSKGAAELFKSMIDNRVAAANGGKGDIRAAEQKITPWQDDASVSACPLCSASFHPLTNRKHHCRLCGKIICSLPIKKPQRPVPCSLLFVADPKTGLIEEVSEGVDYGVRPRNNSLPGGKGTKGQSGKAAVDEKFLKGVRICRECKPIMLRQQYMHEAKRVPTFARLYQALILLEAEIEEALPQFQELMLSLANYPDDAPPKEATAARKRLLESFAEYDALSKRIRKLPCPGGPGSSQDRVQAAILTRANLFLQKNMFPLQSLPKPKKRPSTPGQADGDDKDVPVIDPDSELAHALQPLLEQEALLETFIEEAKAHRKFEDAKTLNANLGEIRAEIDRIMDNADGGAANAKSRTGKGK